jgi:peptidoglycan glycosyltransferase
VVLAETRKDGGQNKRVYPQGDHAAHILGYLSERYGRSGLESAYNNYLLGLEGPDKARNFYYYLLGQDRQKGGDIVLTIDSALQKEAEELLGNRRGAVVMLDCRTGAVRVLASSPRYDPNNLESNWARLTEAQDAPLLNRATQGAYPPGSTFKLLTAAGVLATRPGAAAGEFQCPGYYVVDGYRLTDNNEHGQVDLEKALAVSCNTAFAQLGLDLGWESFARTMKTFGMDQNSLADLETRPSTYASGDRRTQTELASSAIGQGEMLVNPLQMALMTSAIAYQGRLMEPYLVEYIKDSTGAVLRTTTPRRWLGATTPAIAGEIRLGMVSAVRSGTATSAAVPGVQVAGKTGSAQNPHGQTHAWFVGFAPADEPRLCVAVVVENAGSGGGVAAPLGGKLLRSAFGMGY